METNVHAAARPRKHFSPLITLMVEEIGIEKKLARETHYIAGSLRTNSQKDFNSFVIIATKESPSVEIVRTIINQ
jgi:hypothetical protein